MQEKMSAKAIKTLTLIFCFDIRVEHELQNRL